MLANDALNKLFIPTKADMSKNIVLASHKGEEKEQIIAEVLFKENMMCSREITYCNDVIIK